MGEKIIFNFLVISACIIILTVILFVKFKRINLLEKIKILKLKTMLFFNKNEEARKYALKLADKYPRNYAIHKILGELYE